MLQRFAGARVGQGGARSSHESKPNARPRAQPSDVDIFATVCTVPEEDCKDDVGLPQTKSPPPAMETAGTSTMRMIRGSSSQMRMLRLLDLRRCPFHIDADAPRLILTKRGARGSPLQIKKPSDVTLRNGVYLLQLERAVAVLMRDEAADKTR